MFKVKHSTFVDRPPQDVFDFISDPARMAEWTTVIAAEWVTDGPHGVGSRRRSTGRFLGRTVESESEITVWEKPSRFDTKTGGPFTADMTHTLEEKDGGTQLTLEANIEAASLFKIAEPLLKRQVDRQMETDLGAMKVIMESEAA